MFGVGILFFLGLVGSMIFSAARTVQVGDRIILQTRPVDPRDLFRGEYVILRYAIENDDKIRAVIQGNQNQVLKRAPVPQTDALYVDTPIYVQLRTDERGVASVVKAQVEEPSQLAGWIRGQATASGVRFPSLEQFYVPEGVGKHVEALGAQLHVEISIRNGNAQPVKLLDGNLEPVNLVPNPSGNW